MEDLPYIDEHGQSLDVPPDVAWRALVRVLGRERLASRTLARLLDCDPAQSTPDFAGRPGDAVPGFRVVDAEFGRRLVLRGRHRFSSYALTFIFTGDYLRAITHAEFPGVLGGLYRGAVIGTRAHRVVTRYLVRQVARAAHR